jgi:hypothetical protein
MAQNHQVATNQAQSQPPAEIENPLVGEENRAKWTQAAREAYYKDHPENFAGPNMSFPIKDGSDVDDAWRLAGHADDPEAVRAKIKSIAKRLGLQASLPDTAKENNEEGERMQRAAKHPPFTGKHAHGHEHTMDGYDHEHEHEHKNDNNHDHSHLHELPGEGARSSSPDLSGQDNVMTTERGTLPATLDIYAPIRHIDPERREVTVTATAERLDAYKTIIGFEGSRDAFNRWPGNIREMHDPHKAVGRALKIEPREQEKEIDVTLRISRGAEDTWQKILDGTLTGASIGARNGKWGKFKLDGEEVPFLERYDLVELSLVDNPACPGCNVKLIRSNNLLSDILDNSEPVSLPVGRMEEDITRAGATLSKANRDKLHGMRDSAMAMCADAGCDECKQLMTALQDDGDGDTDLPRVVAEEIQRQLAPIVQRMQVTLTRHSSQPEITREIIGDEIQRRMEAVESTLKTGLDEVRAAMLERIGEVRDLAIRIAEQPTPGGPLANLTPVDKRIGATTPGIAQNQNLDDIAAIQRVAELGLLKDQQSQIEAAAAIIKRQHAGIF